MKRSLSGADVARCSSIIVTGFVWLLFDDYSLVNDSAHRQAPN